MGGVVSYTDWSHVYLNDPRVKADNLDGFVGAPGVKKIIRTSGEGGISKLYWRTAGSASSYYPSRFDSDGDGDPDIQTQSSFQFDVPAYRPIYRSVALTPDHLLLIPASEEQPSHVRLKAHAPRETAFGIRIHARVTAPSERTDQVYLYYAADHGAVEVHPLEPLREMEGRFIFYRVSSNALETTTLPDGKRPEGLVCREGEIGLYWPKGSKAKVELNTVELISLERLKRDADATADLLSLDLGPVTPGLRDQPWNDALFTENTSVEAIAGDPKRRDDFARMYQSPANPFGENEDQISLAVKEARAEGMKIYLWFTLGEENHYGSGPISAFARKHPEWREVDERGHVWRGRLSLAFPEVRKYKVGMVKEAVERFRPDGVLIDFVRRGLRDPYLEESKVAHHPVRDHDGYSIFGYDSANLKAFHAAYPDQEGTPLNSDPEWIDWRVASHTRLMEEIRAAIGVTPISVAVFSGSAADSRRGDLLDWKDWAKRGLVNEIMFMLDNSTDGRPYVRPFGSPPKPTDSVGAILADRRRELPPGFHMTAGIYAYRIDSSTIPDLVAEAGKGEAQEIAWWETASLEWTEGFSGEAWKRIQELASPQN